MTTWTDLFAGAGGSSTGAIQVPNVQIRIAANHNQIVTDIHNFNHPDTDHAVVDLHKEDPRFFPKTDCLWASPECKKWSQANGSKLPAIEEGLFEDPLSDDAKTRSRLLMFDVLRFIEHHRYRLVIVENVVDIATQAQYATAWNVWRSELRALGYQFRVVSLNSMHAQTFGSPAPQSRDRIYIVCWPEGEKAPDMDRVLRPKAYCFNCDELVESVQSFKRNREVGRYKQAYIFCCSRCGKQVEPGWLPAAAAIDWSIPGERIADKNLKPKTIARITAGIARYWGALMVEAGGNQYDAADPNHRNFGDPNAYYRTWPVEEALRTLHTTETKALLVPVEAREGKQAQTAGDPMRTQTTRQETALAFMAEFYGTSTARSINDPASTFTAKGNHHALVMSYYSRDDATNPANNPIPTITCEPRHALLEPLIHRHNEGGAEMTTRASEYMRTLTTGGNVSLIQGAQFTGKPRVTDGDLKRAAELVPEALFRMLRPHEIAAGMAFPADYKWQPYDGNKHVSNRDLVKAAGNAVTPPAARDLVAAAVASLGEAA